MEFAPVAVGASMIVLGFLVKRFHSLVAGYNTMSKTEKEKVDIQGLTSFMRLMFILMGLVIIIGFYLLVWMGQVKIAEWFIQAIILVFVLFIVIRAQKYSSPKKKR